METINRARKWTWVYVVDSIILELLLGEEDAEDLRIIKFYQKGRKETAVDKVTMLATFKLRQVGIKLRTKKTMPAAIIEAQRQKNLENSQTIHRLCLHEKGQVAGRRRGPA